MDGNDAAMQIPLTCGKVALIDAVDYPKIYGYKWRFHSGYARAFKYNPSTQKNDAIHMSHMIMPCPPEMEVDHINRDRLDNRKCNLRVVTRSQNCANRGSFINSVSQYKGVHWNKKMELWEAAIRKAAQRCVCEDGRARGLFQFNGAAKTNRWAGRLIQLQNLVRNEISTLDEARELVKMGEFELLESIYGNAPDILSQLIRTMLVPKEGHEFIVADFSAIEARVLAWLAGEQWRLEAFRNGEDIYCASASQMFGVPVVKHGVNGELRQKGKVAELACGYQGGSGALISMGALEMGLKEGELPDIIEQRRNASPHIVQFWWDVEKAATETVKTHEEHVVGKVRFQFYGNTLWMVLPSGRKLAYLKPRLQPNRFGRMSLTFEGMGANNNWARQESYGGRMVENCTQATARDILAEAMRRLEQAGFEIVGHVHDEVIIEAPVGRCMVDEVCRLMAENPPWCPDCPLDAAGYEAPSYYFTMAEIEEREITFLNVGKIKELMGLPLSEEDKKALFAYFDASTQIMVLETGMEGLPEGQYREIAYDRYFERMSYKKIMQKHSVNKKTVQRALGKTKAYLLTYSRWYLDLAGKVKESVTQ